MTSQGYTVSAGARRTIKNFLGQGRSHSTGPVLQSLPGWLPHWIHGKYSNL